MHHAFPSECPYPQEEGTKSPEALLSEDVEASEEERKAAVQADACGPEQAAAEWIVELPWSDTEELVSFEAMAKLDVEVAAAFVPKERKQQFAAAARNPRMLLFGALLVT